MTQPKLRFKREDGTEFPEWEKTKLNSVCDIVGGGTPSTEHEEYWNGNIQWFTPSEIGKSKYVSQSNRTISQIGFERSSARKLPIGTVLLTSRATLGEMAITTTECTTNQGFQSLIPQKICGEYLYYLQPTIKKYCNKKACGSTFNEISKSELGKCIIPLPCPEEQHKIASFLSSVDEVITQSEAEVQNLEQQKKAAMQKIFSQEVRFRCEDGTTFPEWEEKAITEICESILGGGTPTTENKDYWNGDIAWVSSSDLDNNDIHHLTITRFITEEAIRCSATKRIPRDSVLIVSRVGVGKVVVAPCELCTSQDFTNIVKPKCNSLFLGYMLSIIMQIKANSVQGTSIKGVTAKEIKQYRISIPCLEEQQKIADFLSAYDEAIACAKQELDKWKELKKGLLQQMFV